MKRLLLCLPLTLCLMGCPTATSTTPPQALAPGYTSSTDQQFGQALAAARGLANQAVNDYAKLTRPQQLMEKDALNAFSSAVNAADLLYIDFHIGRATLAQMQAAMDKVNAAQTAYANVAVK